MAARRSASKPNLNRLVYFSACQTAIGMAAMAANMCQLRPVIPAMRKKPFNDHARPNPKAISTRLASVSDAILAVPPLRRLERSRHDQHLPAGDGDDGERPDVVEDKDEFPVRSARDQPEQTGGQLECE